MNDGIHIVLDSTASAGQTPLAADARCHVLPLIVRHGNLEWRDGEKTTAEMFKLVKESGELPKTSQPPVGDLLDIFTSLAEQGKKVIGIFVDGVLSGTCQTARMAARQVMQEIPGADIRIFDSLTAATPISGLALDVLQKADEGASMDELEAFINDAITRTETCFSVSTLEYLQKGGRIGKMSAAVGNLLSVRPVITCNKEGVLQTVQKVRGNSAALEAAVSQTVKAVGDQKRFRLFVAHADAAKRARTAAEILKTRLPNAEDILLAEIGPALAVHSGPGLLGMGVQLL